MLAEAAGRSQRLPGERPLQARGAAAEVALHT